MNFYSSIADYYNLIFPDINGKTNLINPYLKENTRLLDIGCSTGRVLKNIDIKEKNVFYGIDLDEKMVLNAKKDNRRENILFKEMNMLDIDKNFSENYFDVVFSFGNTIVHLQNERSILDFFNSVKRVLKKDGRFIFQILNYKRILNEKVKELPLIENNGIRFERKYSFRSDGLLDFNTILYKNDKVIVENSVPLLPILPERLDVLLKKAGFSDIEFYGDMKKSKFDENGSYAVVGNIKIN